MIRIAFTTISPAAWTGGHNYLLNLLSALTQHAALDVQPVLFAGERSATANTHPLLAIGVEIVRTPAFDDARRARQLMRALVFGRDSASQAEFDRHRIDCVFEAARFHGSRLRQPAIAWMPDFQHRALPHLFGRLGWWRRELGFRAQINARRYLMLSSEDSRQECERLYPASRGHTHVVRFATPCAPPVMQPRAVADRYGLPERFILMPNQFWQHKNHALVIDALALLRDRGRADIVVAAPGAQMDSRRPAYFSELMARVARHQVEAQFRPLGLIPYVDLMALLRASDALLNPSLFEGWSTSVEEARANNIPILLSDLAVHREQASDIARFFDRHSAASLADVMAETSAAPFVDHAALDRQARNRVARYARAFADLARSAVESAGNP